MNCRDVLLLVRNENIRQPMNDWTKETRKAWDNHIFRKDENIIFRIVLDKFHVGRRSGDRPARRWREYI